MADKARNVDQLFRLCAAQAALLHPQHLAEIRHDLTELRQQTTTQALNVVTTHAPVLHHTLGRQGLAESASSTGQEGTAAVYLQGGKACCEHAQVVPHLQEDTAAVQAAVVSVSHGHRMDG